MDSEQFLPKYLFWILILLSWIFFAATIFYYKLEGKIYRIERDIPRDFNEKIRKLEYDIITLKSKERR